MHVVTSLQKKSSNFLGFTSNGVAKNDLLVLCPARLVVRSSERTEGCVCVCMCVRGWGQSNRARNSSGLQLWQKMKGAIIVGARHFHLSLGNSVCYVIQKVSEREKGPYGS